MGRKDTIAAKSIRKMYEQLNLNQSDIFSKTKLLLGVYRDVVWITLSESARVNEELAYYGEELDSALVYLELFAPDTEKQEFESRISALFENKWMVDLIDTAIGDIRCLCPKCLNDYFRNPNYVVRRLDPFAKSKGTCDKCNDRGWDYIVYDKRTSFKGKGV